MLKVPLAHKVLRVHKGSKDRRAQPDHKVQPVPKARKETLDHKVHKDRRGLRAI